MTTRRNHGLGAVARGYTEIAADYDRLTSEDAWMRRVLWDHYTRLFRSGDRILDLGCGTGADTLFLAALGANVTALDASTGMVAALEAKVADAGLADRVDTAIGDAARLDDFEAGAFDGVVSAFAVLNTLPDLVGAGAGIARLLRPGGRAVIHLLSRSGCWERAGSLGRRRASNDPTAREEIEVSIGGSSVTHRRYGVEEAARQLEGSLLVRSSYALGFLWPRRAGRWIPSTPARWLGRFEGHLGRRPPWVGWGRFLVLELENPAVPCGPPLEPAPDLHYRLSQQRQLGGFPGGLGAAPGRGKR